VALKGKGKLGKEDSGLCDREKKTSNNARREGNRVRQPWKKSLNSCSGLIKQKCERAPGEKRRGNGEDRGETFEDGP